EAGGLADVGDLEPGLAQRSRGAAGGEQGDAVAGQRPGKFQQAGLVGNRKQRAANADGFAHGQPIPYSRSFLRKVARWMPSIAAARLWLPSQWLSTSANSGISSSRSAIS